MMVYVNGQDIARLGLGVIDANKAWLHRPQAYETRPEAYLAQLESYLAGQNIARTEIRGFILVQGPGSATALRTSHALVNALAFALGVEVIGIEKPIELPDAEILPLAAEALSRTFVLPVYAHAPNITTTKRDALKRKTS